MTARASAVGFLAVAILCVFADPASAEPPNWIDQDGSPPDNSTNYFSVSEADESVTLRFTPALDPTHSVFWETEALTADEGRDFVPASGRWPADSAEDDQEPSATIRLLPDDVGEGTERFGVLVWLDGYANGGPPPHDHASCAAHGWCDYAEVEIEDDDALPTEDGSSTSVASDSVRPSLRPGTRPEQSASTAGGGPAQVAPSASGSPAINATVAQYAAGLRVDTLEPGNGFELLGERLNAVGGPDGADGGQSKGNASLVVALVMGFGLVGGVWAWRRRRRTW